mmetsp:Transcript_37904/g.75896  ORF Transcript_37904/g.75896 Transcript_37904/m.75896 type:complete len:101 (-) Transcript_37904:23-325(-)
MAEAPFQVRSISADHVQGKHQELADRKLLTMCTGMYTIENGKLVGGQTGPQCNDKLGEHDMPSPDSNVVSVSRRRAALLVVVIVRFAHFFRVCGRRHCHR